MIPSPEVVLARSRYLPLYLPHGRLSAAISTAKSIIYHVIYRIKLSRSKNR